MNQSVVQHEKIDILCHIQNKNQESIVGTVASVAGMHDLATAEQRNHYVGVCGAGRIDTAELFLTEDPAWT